MRNLHTEQCSFLPTTATHELAIKRRHEVHNFKALTTYIGPIPWLISSLLYGAMISDKDMS